MYILAHMRPYSVYPNLQPSSMKIHQRNEKSIIYCTDNYEL